MSGWQSNTQRRRVIDVQPFDLAPAVTHRSSRCSRCSSLETLHNGLIYMLERRQARL